MAQAEAYALGLTVVLDEALCLIRRSCRETGQTRKNIFEINDIPGTSIAGNLVWSHRQQNLGEIVVFVQYASCHRYRVAQRTGHPLSWESPQRCCRVCMSAIEARRTQGTHVSIV